MPRPESATRRFVARLLPLLLASACGGSGTKADGPGGAREGGSSDAGDGAATSDDAGDAAASSNDAGDAAASSDADGRIEVAEALDGALDARDAAGAASGDASTDLSDVSSGDGAAEGPPADAASEAPPPASGSPLRALAISTGLLHTCALLDNHGVKCWGYNAYGSLGLGDGRDRGASASDMGDHLPFVDLGTGRTAVAVSAGRYHTCAILDDGTVKCWGLAGWTGLPARPDIGNRGDAPGEMGDNLPALDFGPGRKARLLASGYASSCVSLDDGSIWCWSEGSPYTPMVVPLAGHGAVVQLAPFHMGAVALFADGTMSPDLPVSGGTTFSPGKVVYVAGSAYEGCAVLEDGRATCGSQVPAPWEMTTGLAALGLTLGDACGLFAGGVVRCWGDCGASTPATSYWCGTAQADHSAPVALGQRAASIGTGGGFHTCALLGDGSVKCWVLGDTSCTGTPCPVPAQDGQDPNLGSSVEVVTTNDVRRYGAWRAVDLGTHP